MESKAHATNEQMAEIMGWTLVEGHYWHNADGWVFPFSNDETLKHFAYFNPIADLNHAARVEARLAELGLIVGYFQHLIQLVQMDKHDIYEYQWFAVITATAQTRCDAAWATWQQYQEQA